MPTRLSSLVLRVAMVPRIAQSNADQTLKDRVVASRRHNKGYILAMDQLRCTVSRTVVIASAGILAC
jgi:hypothetical protein